MCGSGTSSRFCSCSVLQGLRNGFATTVRSGNMCSAVEPTQTNPENGGAMNQVRRIRRSQQDHEKTRAIQCVSRHHLHCAVVAIAAVEKSSPTESHGETESSSVPIIFVQQPKPKGFKADVARPFHVGRCRHFPCIMCVSPLYRAGTHFVATTQQ